MTKVLYGQSLLDIAIQAAGSVEAAFETARINGISVTDRLEAGMTLKDAPVANAAIAAYYAAKGLHPATDYPDTDADGGIGDMAIGINFIVS